MTREDARALWAASGLDYSVLTTSSVRRLRALIDRELRSSGLMQKSLRAGRARVWVSAGDVVADIQCNAYYFKNRQAVTFERNGFIGFAGWADPEHIQPILKAFTAWIAETDRLSPAPKGGGADV